MDISPADSTPTSETSGPKAATPYTPDPRLTPTAGSGASVATPVSLATALPRLLSHPPTSNTPNQPMRPASYTPNASNRYGTDVKRFITRFCFLSGPSLKVVFFYCCNFIVEHQT